MNADDESFSNNETSNSNTSVAPERKGSWKTEDPVPSNDLIEFEEFYVLIGLVILEGHVGVATVRHGSLSSHETDQNIRCIYEQMSQQEIGSRLYRSQLSEFGQHGIPLALEIFLLPDCIHGNRGFSPQQLPTSEYLLVEQWSITTIPKTDYGCESYQVESMHSLWRKISVYLEASFLKKWNLRPDGGKGKHLHCRLAIYGKTSLTTSQSSTNLLNHGFYHLHDFPLINADGNHYLHVTCLALESYNNIPDVVCGSCNSSIHLRADSVEPSLSPSPFQSTFSSDCESMHFSHPSSLSRPESLLSNTFMQNMHTFPGVSRFRQNSKSLKSDETLDNSSSGTSYSSIHDATHSNRLSLLRDTFPFCHDQNFSFVPIKDDTPFPKEGFDTLNDIQLQFSHFSVSSTPWPLSYNDTSSPTCQGDKGRSEQSFDSTNSHHTENLRQISPSKNECHNSLPSLKNNETFSSKTPHSNKDEIVNDSSNLGTSFDAPIKSSIEKSAVSHSFPANVTRCLVQSRTPYSLFSSSGLPLQSSPAPAKRHPSGRFESDESSSGESHGRHGHSLGSATSSSHPLVNHKPHSLECGTQMSSHTENNLKASHEKTFHGLSKCFNQDPSHHYPYHHDQQQQQDGSSHCDPISILHDIKDKVKEPMTSPATAMYSSQHLVINFEESMLAGRITPKGTIDGFRVDISASNLNVSQRHVCLPMKVFFFHLTDDQAPSPYLGYVDVETHFSGRNGYQLPKRGTLQLTLFNPSNHVVKLFVVMYDLSDMPPNSTTFLRQRTLYMPVTCPDDKPNVKKTTKVLKNDGSLPDKNVTSQYPVLLRYLLHLRFLSTRSGRIYLHKDIRIIFSQDKFEFDSRLSYDLRTFIDLPSPRYSTRR